MRRGVDGIPLKRLLDANVAVQDILVLPGNLVSREGSPALFEIVATRGKVLFGSGDCPESFKV